MIAELTVTLAGDGDQVVTAFARARAEADELARVTAATDELVCEVGEASAGMVRAAFESTRALDVVAGGLGDGC